MRPTNDQSKARDPACSRGRIRTASKPREQCTIASVGKRRDGGTRYWCTKHKADATAKYGKRARACRAAHIPPIPKKDIFELSLDRYKGGVALWGAVPAVYDTTRLPRDRGIHLHARVDPEGKKEIDRTFRAVRIMGGTLPAEGILVSEVDAIYYMATSVFGYQMRYVTCTHCGWPHLDRDWFSVHPHRRHLCAGCGNHFPDSEIGIGNPIAGARAACGVDQQKTVISRQQLDIEQADFPGGLQIWGSNPAFLWTSDRPEEEGIHVHAWGNGTTGPKLDETYGHVTIDGVRLDPVMVRVGMAQSALPSLAGRVRSIQCPSCERQLFSLGTAAFTPTVVQTCSQCGERFASPGRLRRAIANPLPEVLQKLAIHAVRPPQAHKLDLLPETP